MPYSINDIKNNSKEAERRIINIFNSDIIKDLPTIKNTTFARLIEGYSSIDIINRPNHIKKIMKYIWFPPFNENILNQFYHFEHFLLAIGRRDHFIHQFQVMLLGLNFCEIFFKRIPNTKGVFKFDKIEDILNTWLIASMLHDVGYPYTDASKMLGDLSSLYRNFHLYHIADQLDMIKELQHKLDKEYHFGRYTMDENPSEDKKFYFDIKQFLRTSIERNLTINNEEAKSLEKELLFHPEKKIPNHGYVSSVIVCRSVLDSYFKDLHVRKWDGFTNSEEYKQLISALGAILLHSIPGRYHNKIQFNRNPFAYLLFILDNIQDWSRNIFPDDKWPEYYLCNFEKSDELISLKFILYSDNWPEDMKNTVVDSLREKGDIINKPSKPSPPLDLSVEIEYDFNKDISQEPIKFEISL